MTALDIIIIGVFIASAVMGFRKGLIAQIGSVAAILIGIIACRIFGAQVTEIIVPAQATGEDVDTMSRWGATILAYACLYIVAYYAVILVARLLKLVTHTLLLGPLDSIAGAAVSVAKWFMAVSVAVNIYIIIFPGTDLTSAAKVCGSRPVAWIIDLAPTVWGAFTHNMQQ